MQVSLRGFDRLMTEPHRTYRAIDACFSSSIASLCLRHVRRYRRLETPMTNSSRWRTRTFFARSDWTLSRKPTHHAYWGTAWFVAVAGCSLFQAGGRPARAPLQASAFASRPDPCSRIKHLAGSPVRSSSRAARHPRYPQTELRQQASGCIIPPSHRGGPIATIKDLLDLRGGAISRRLAELPLPDRRYAIRQASRVSPL